MNFTTFYYPVHLDVIVSLSLTSAKQKTSFNWIRKLANTFLWKRFATSRKKAVKNAQLSFIEFVMNAAINSAFHEDLYWQIENFKNKSDVEKIKMFPGFYLFVERYVFNSVESSQYSFREALYQRFSLAIDSNKSLKIIFLPSDKQVIALSRKFLFSLAHRTQKVVGAKTRLPWQLMNFLNATEKSETFSSEKMTKVSQSLVRISHDYFNELSKQSGERTALKIYNEAYERQLLRYQNLDTFPEMLKLFPARALDEGKYNLLSLQQMKHLLNEKVESLEILSTELQEKNSLLGNQNDELSAQAEQLNQQNQQLMEAQTLIELMNTEINSYSRKLEEKVEERTKELAHSNRLLTHYNANLEQYTFAISHQLKAPVARLMGLTNLLRIVPDSEKGVIGESAHLAAKELEGIFKDLVHSLNLKHDAAALRRESVDIEELLHESWARLMHEHGLPSVKFQCSSIDSPPVVTDRKYLSEAIANILDNTIKFRNTDEVPSVDAIVSMEEGKVLISISDSGVGFEAEEVKSKLFTPFGRFNQTYSGRGMGLYLTRQHINILGGEINLTSAPGNGTQVRIELPLN
jgi:signal transduction histidine kinase